MKLDLEALRAGLARLAGVVPDRQLRVVEELIRDGGDGEVFRLNPLQLAEGRGIGEDEAVSLLLHAAHAGLFHMTWHLLCPVCGDVVSSFGGLQGVHAHYRCDLCQADFDTVLDEYVEVAFTVSPQVREIRYHRPEELPIEDFYFDCEFHPGAVSERGVRLVDFFRKNAKLLAYLEPGERREARVEVTEGYLEGCDRLNHRSFCLRVTKAEAAPEPVPRLDLVLDDEGFAPRDGEIPSGPLLISCANRGSRRAAVIAVHFPEEDVPRAFSTYGRFVTGRRLATSPTYRSLHGTELLRDDGGLRIREVTVMFTDIRGSVELFSRLGDLQAFALVREHYGVAAGLAVRHAGTIVKVIGDSVMMAFDDVRGAARTALEMVPEVRELGRVRGLPELGLRVGLHRGPAILVSLDGRLDFFGQAVNVASRLQEMAEPGEVLLTAEAADAAGVAAILTAGGEPGRRRVALQGLPEEREIVCVRPR